MISVIIPCYNYGRFLGESIESALAQAAPGVEVEVIVVDDGSTDATSAVAAAYGDKIRYLFQENRGLSAARNTGMAAASNDLVTFLDADDCLVPGALGRLLAVWSSLDPKPGILASRHLEVDEHCEKLVLPKPVSDGEISKITAKQLVFCNRFSPTIIAERNQLVMLGGFDTGLTASEDRDLWIRTATKWEVLLVNHVSIKKRNHGMNLSRAAENQTAMIDRVLRKSFTNKDIELSWSDKRYALAVCNYQSALMYAESNCALEALKKMILSISQYPIRRTGDDSIPRFSRLRGTASLLLKLLLRSRCP